MAVIRCPEKGPPWRPDGAFILKGIGGSDSVSAKVYLSGRKRRRLTAQDGTRTALYLRVSTADQKPDLQYDGLRTYAAQAVLDVVQDYCDVGVSGRREGRPHLSMAKHVRMCLQIEPGSLSGGFDDVLQGIDAQRPAAFCREHVGAGAVHL